MKDQLYISAAELDSIARGGLDDLRRFFAGDRDEDMTKSVESLLKLLGISTRKMGAENSRVALLMKAAKLAAATPEEQQLLWQHVAGASGLPVRKMPPALAPKASTSSGPKSGKSKQRKRSTA